MYCINCGSEIADGSSFCPSCGSQVGAAKQNAGVAERVGGAVGGVADKLNEMAGGTGHVTLKFGDFFKETFKRHPSGESDELFICGTPSTTPALQDVDSAWPRPWVWSRVLLALAVVLVGLIIMWESFANTKAVPGIIVVGSFMVPVATMVLFFETNAPRNISFVKVLKIFFVGGVLSLVATLMFSNVVTGSGTGELWPSMLTGLIEEAAKVVAIVYFMNRARGRNYVLNGLLIGGAVGAGFAAFESSGYAFDNLVYYMLGNLGQLNAETVVSILSNPLGYGTTAVSLGYSAAMNVIALRGMLAIGGHVAWAAVEGAVLALCEDDDGFKLAQLTNPVFLGFAVGMAVLHGVWDMDVPFLDDITLFMGITPKYLLLIIAVWIVIAVMLNRGLAQINELSQAPSTDSAFAASSASPSPSSEEGGQSVLP